MVSTVVWKSATTNDIHVKKVTQYVSLTCHQNIICALRV